MRRLPPRPRDTSAQLGLFGTPKVQDHVLALHGNPPPPGSLVLEVLKSREPGFGPCPTLSWDIPAIVPRGGKVLMRVEPHWFNWKPRPTSLPEVSRWTGKPGLDQVEGPRSFCGLSVDLAGHLGRDGSVLCAACMPYLFFPGYAGRPLFEPATATGEPRPGEEFSCGRCERKFKAHRDERLDWGGIG